MRLCPVYPTIAISPARPLVPRPVMKEHGFRLPRIHWNRERHRNDSPWRLKHLAAFSLNRNLPRRPPHLPNRRRQPDIQTLRQELRYRIVTAQNPERPVAIDRIRRALLTQEPVDT